MTGESQWANRFELMTVSLYCHSGPVWGTGQALSRPPEADRKVAKVNRKAQEGSWIPAFAGMTVKPQPIIAMLLDYRIGDEGVFRP